MDGGKVNLLRDLEVLMEVNPNQQQGGPQAQGSVARGRGPAPGQSRRAMAAAAAAGRPSLRDPDLYAALMEECVKEESTPKGREYVPPALVTNYLIRNDVRPLKKRSTKFPKAQYYCRLCDYHCDTLTICISHIKDERHGRLARMQEIETTLYHLPKPSRQHLDYLEGLLQRTQAEEGLSVADVAEREATADAVGVLLAPALPEGSKVRLYGSCMTGFGLKSSALNLDLQIPENSPPHLALIAASDFVAGNPKFR